MRIFYFIFQRIIVILIKVYSSGNFSILLFWYCHTFLFTLFFSIVYYLWNSPLNLCFLFLIVSNYLFGFLHYLDFLEHALNLWKIFNCTDCLSTYSPPSPYSWNFKPNLSIVESFSYNNILHRNKMKFRTFKVCMSYRFT